MAQRGKRAKLRSFYEPALAAAERDDLAEARGVEGLDEEIAVLRLRLRRALEEHPEDFAIMARGVELLVRAVSTRYRLSKEASGDLGDNIAATLRGVGEQLFPEAFPHE